MFLCAFPIIAVAQDDYSLVRLTKFNRKLDQYGIQSDLFCAAISVRVSIGYAMAPDHRVWIGTGATTLYYEIDLVQQLASVPCFGDKSQA